MANLTTAVLTYSYLDRPVINFGTVDLSDPDLAVLSQVDSLMASAAAAFTARQYDAAISDYRAAESLLFNALLPGWVPEVGQKVRPVLPRSAELFEPLLSATSQWLNIIPVSPPLSPVRPTVAVDPATVATATPLADGGLSVASADQTGAAEALADLRLADIYAGQGNTKASTGAVNRAKQADATLAKALEPTEPSLRPAATAGRTIRAPANRTAETPVTAAPPTLSVLPITVLSEKQLGLVTGSTGQFTVQPVQWAAAASPSPTDLISLLYAPHVSASVLPDALANVSSIWERAAVLPHDYFYVIPLALAECYDAMGDYATAETFYLQAAGYTYLNTAVEGPYVWLKLANLYLEWGDSLYRQGDRTGADTQYAKVVTPEATTPPASSLYTLAGLSMASSIATALLPQLATLAQNGTSSVNAADVTIASALLAVWGREQQINAGLDFWGNWENAIPIWSFAYLQSVATNFAQLAMGAEQEVINFWSQADQASLTQSELQNQVSQANAQVNVQLMQALAADAQAVVYQDGVTLANLRAADAAANASDYQSKNSTETILQAEAQQNSGGDSGDIKTVTSWAATLLSGGSVSGSHATVAAALNLAAADLSQEYQVDSMNRTATEMQLAAAQAQDQATAANVQASAANAQLQAAVLAANGAAQTLATFDADIFTPQVWKTMGDYMLAIYQGYMYIAIQTAKLMQEAYNFENDADLAWIKDSYSGVVAGLLGADALMADIQQFTYDLITDKRGKKQYVKTSISLAEKYGYLFQTQLVQTGTMTFETTLDDFDSAFPGSYAGRIQSVSVDVQGIVPPTGLSGTLTNGGISWYRLPSDIATPATPSKLRIQNADTLVLSDYDPAVDGTLSSATSNQMGIFEGAGVASTWTLSLPKQLNDLNYGTLTDVVLTFLYETRFDPQLVPTVLAQLASRPGWYDREWAIPLAWLYPDLFYGFVQQGTLTLSLAASDFPINQTSPVVTAVAVVVTTQPGTSAAGLGLTLTAPGQTAATGTTAADGTISSQTAGSPWAASTGGGALGDWVLAVPGGSTFDRSALANIALVLDYSFTPRS